MIKDKCQTCIYIDSTYSHNLRPPAKIHCHGVEEQWWSRGQGQIEINHHLVVGLWCTPTHTWSAMWGGVTLVRGRGWGVGVSQGSTDCLATPHILLELSVCSLPQIQAHHKVLIPRIKLSPLITHILFRRALPSCA